MTEMNKNRQAELIKLLRNEFEHVEKYKGKYEYQWLMGVSLNKMSSGEYSAKVTVKTSESPYIDGMVIKVFLVDGQVKLEEDHYEKGPDIMGSPETDAVRWHQHLADIIYLQRENPYDDIDDILD